MIPDYLIYVAIGIFIPIFIYVPYRIGYIHALRRMSFSHTEKDLEKIKEMMQTLEEMDERAKKITHFMRD